MYRILDKLFVGRSSCVPMAQDFGFSIVGACKHPFHQQIARLKGNEKEGYLKISPDEPEYLFAKREHALYLNLVDCDDSKYIADEMIDEAIKFIHKEISGGRKVFIACNMAESRSPSIAFMYLIYIGYFDSYTEFSKAYKKFKSIYPMYSPRHGMLDYTAKYFEKHRRLKENGKRS